MPTQSVTALLDFVTPVRVLIIPSRGTVKYNLISAFCYFVKMINSQQFSEITTPHTWPYYLFTGLYASLRDHNRLFLGLAG